MSLAEIMYRMKQACRMSLEMAGCFTVPSPPSPVPQRQAKGIIKIPSDVDTNVYCRAAERIIAGRYPIFAIAEPGPDMWSDWNRDLRTGIRAPLSFGKTINYRDSRLVGDIKYLWELNRHLHLPTLAQAYALSGERKYLNVIGEHLETWLAQCQYLKGINWTSSLELGIRLINWAITWQLIGGYESQLFSGKEGSSLRRRWCDAVFQHCHFIAGHFSRYSSANNHLIGEAAGLFVGSVFWQYWKQSEAWEDISRRILEKETLKQNGPDGVNREQAIAYQSFVLEFLIVAGLLGRRNGRDFSRDYWERIESMIGFVAAIMDVSGNVPMIGDADDGYVTRLCPIEGWNPYRSLLVTGAYLFDREEFMRKAGHVDDRTRWLLGGCSPDTLSGRKGELPPRRAFEDGGYYVIGTEFETEHEIRMVVDAGPLGYGSIAAHGHADALAVTLSIGGKEILVDPGTYAYHTQKKWRDYFRGTSAHNTVRIDRRDQSLAAGNFMWLEKADGYCEKWAVDEEEDLFIGSHTGYLRLSDPVLHRREIVFDKTRRIIRITDRLEAKKEHFIEIFWHFSEHCHVEMEGADVRVNNGESTIYMKLPCDGLSSEIQCGAEDPPLGWVSRHFDVKLASPTVVVSGHITGRREFVTEIRCA